MFDPEKIISLYFNGGEVLTQDDIDKLSVWINQSDENTARFIQASFMHRAIHDHFVGEDVRNNVLFDQMEMSDSSILEDTDSNVLLQGVEFQAIIDDDLKGSESENDLTEAEQELLRMERAAPTVEVTKKEPEKKTERELIQKVVYPPRPKRKLTKFQKFQLGACAAAVLIFAALIFFTPDPVILPIVAELNDSIDAVWDDQMQAPDKYGDMVQSKYKLKEGYASILFRDGSTITVEAPAELSLHSRSSMSLHYGKIYAVVPEEARGFTVNAGSSKIVDLGTEFGVEIDRDKSTQLHVTKGKTILLASMFNKKKLQLNVDAGAAKKVHNGNIEDIPIDEFRFTRKIDSKTGVVANWPDSLVSYIPISGDNDSGISMEKTYTHALDFGEGPAAKVNGVSFARVISGGNFPSLVETSQVVGTGSSTMHRLFDSGADSDSLNVTGDIRNLLADLMHGSSNAVIKLTGLTPGKRYQLRLYHRRFKKNSNERYQKIGFETNGVGSDINGAENIAFFNEDNATELDPNFDNPDQTYILAYDYTLSPGITTLTIYIDSSKPKSQSSFGPYHLYGLTNEVINSYHKKINKSKRQF